MGKKLLDIVRDKIHLLQSGIDLRSIQELLGHKSVETSVETTMIYAHVVAKMNKGSVASPLDML